MMSDTTIIWKRFITLQIDGCLGSAEARIRKKWLIGCVDGKKVDLSITLEEEIAW